MKRLILAVAVLGFTAAYTNADYLIIKVDLANVTVKLVDTSAKGPDGKGFGGGQGIKGGFGKGAAGAAGAGGAGGGGVDGGFGAGGGLGGAGGLGGFGGQRGGGGQGGNPPPKPDPGPQNPPMWVTANVELHAIPQSAGGAAKIDLKWGSPTYVPLHDGAFDYQYVKKEPPARDFDKKFQKELRDGAKDPYRLLSLASFAWNHGLAKDLYRAIDKLKQLEPKHPAVLRYEAMAKIIKTPLTGEDPALKALIDEYRTSGFRVVISEQGHYGLLTNLADNKINNDVLKRRLKQLEDCFESFFYWFTFHENVALPTLPNARLMAVLISEPQEFHKEHDLWGRLAMVGDGFTPRRDNIMILSSKRLDDPYQILAKNNVSLARQLKVAPGEFITGKVWERPESRQQLTATSIAQTMFVVQRALEEEGERVTVSHEGTRQLLAATGMLPRSVIVPEWLQSGIAAYFETPYGAIYPAAGIASWSNLIDFKFHRPKLGTSREVLYNTLSDYYFRQARRSSADLLNNKRDEKLAEKAREDWEKARATSWALTYYLIQNKRFPNLRAYAQEVATWPRDLDLDERALVSCFARAFELGEPTEPRRLNSNLLTSFADGWFREMENVNLEVPEIEVEALRARREPKTVFKAPPVGLPGGNKPID